MVLLTRILRSSEFIYRFLGYNTNCEVGLNISSESSLQLEETLSIMILLHSAVSAELSVYNARMSPGIQKCTIKC